MRDITSSVGLNKYRSWLNKESISLQVFIFYEHNTFTI